jgi:uncharacterized protein YxjI
MGETPAVDSWNKYQLRQELFSIGEDFWIENQRGEQVFKVDGKVFTLRETFVLQDKDGAELASVQSKLIAFQPTMTIERGGQVAATVEKALFTLFHSHYSIDVAGGPPLEADGDFLSHEFEITANGQTVATISKRWFTLQETFGIAIAPGQDEVLLLCAAISIDEMSEAKPSSPFPHSPSPPF